MFYLSETLLLVAGDYSVLGVATAVMALLMYTLGLVHYIKELFKNKE